jgi:hypothetical protein
MTDNRAKHYRSLCKSAAKLLNCKPTDEQALHYGLLMLAREGFANRIIDGLDVDPGALMRLDESLKAYMPAAQPMSVAIKIVGPAQTMCPQCSHVFDPESPQRTVAKQPPRTIDAEAVEATDANASTVSHDTPVPNGTPEPKPVDPNLGKLPYKPATDFGPPEDLRPTARL